MSGQIWAVAAEGGYMYSNELSDVLRQQVQPLTKFRQLCDAQDGSNKGLNRGDRYFWNVYSNVATQGGNLSETDPMPETSFTVAQRSLTVGEAGNSVPYTGKLSDLAKHDVVSILDKTLKDDARKYFDISAFNQFNACALRASTTTSTTSITLDTGGVASQTNNVALGTGHVKAIVDAMKEQFIPPYIADDYVCVSHPSTFRNFKNQLESIHQYTETGIAFIFNGEVGRYESTRFIEQSFIPKGGAANATTYNVWTQAAQPWTSGLSSWAFFMGGDTVTEAICIPEEIRAKIPGDYGRSKGIAWYYLGGFGLVHPDSTNGRIVKWDSAA